MCLKYLNRRLKVSGSISQCDLKTPFWINRQRSHLVFPRDRQLLPEAAQNHTVCTRGFQFNTIIVAPISKLFSTKLYIAEFHFQISMLLPGPRCSHAVYLLLHCIYILVWTSLTFEGLILYYRCTDKM